MNANKFSDAMGELGEKYIMEAAVYQGKRTRRIFVKWASFAACLMVVAMVFGIIPLLNNQPASPFVITAYAMDGEVVGYEMTEGECVPISMLKTESGVMCFVFSTDMEDPNAPSSGSILTVGDYSNVIEEIAALIAENGKNYYIFVPGENETAPFYFPVDITDMEKQKIYMNNLIIEETNDSYTATLDFVQEYDRIVK